MNDIVISIAIDGRPTKPQTFTVDCDGGSYEITVTPKRKRDSPDNIKTDESGREYIDAHNFCGAPIRFYGPPRQVHQPAKEDGAAH